MRFRSFHFIYGLKSLQAALWMRGQERGGAVRVSADREVCIQAGNCVMVAGEVFDQDEDGTVTVLTEMVSGEAADHAQEAVNLCPANALSLTED